MQICTGCNTSNLNTAVRCEKCGGELIPVVPQETLPMSRPATHQEMVEVMGQIQAQHIGLATVFSFLIPGLGQIFKGELGKGVIIMIAMVVGLILVGAFTADLPGGRWIVAIAYFIAWIFNIVDARS
ncbi:hypothetical protein EDC14_100142 [Hydrogenispora ethanolica]|jgi:TM2 domain-containing membrane protein YozV|uniref:TM2 domain-containing protein n=1 Tax=Hydrogenispora ethanolica TaxID=1082276 RepID=A0A4R1SDN9_HYDET|nr:hypothetical protein [Hydrogenispora ethanolica]TCL76762.1 hypothetical protein EDC14_100142 [Hydrogenispora ethanolica]